MRCRVRTTGIRIVGSWHLRHSLCTGVLLCLLHFQILLKKPVETCFSRAFSNSRSRGSCFMLSSSSLGDSSPLKWLHSSLGKSRLVTRNWCPLVHIHMFFYYQWRNYQYRPVTNHPGFTGTNRAVTNRPVTIALVPLKLTRGLRRHHSDITDAMVQINI